MRLIASLALVLLLASPAEAQATIAVFPSSATNPATAMPVANPVTYPAAQVACNLSPKAAEVTPIVNPNEARFDDPANPTTRDCAINIGAQFAALPAGSAYKAALRQINGSTSLAWSPFSTNFAVTAAPQTHPCDGAPAAQGTVVEGSRTIDWCWDGKDANGADTVVTAWTVTIDGTRHVLTGVTVSSTANAAGRRLYSASINLSRGSRVLRIAASNSVGEATFSATWSVTVAAPPAVPSAAEIRGVR